MLLDIMCESCGNVFQRQSWEIARNNKKGHKQYCSRSCASKTVANNFGSSRQWEHLNPGNKGDEFSPFRVFMCRIRARMRDRGRECSVTVEDLKEQWEIQNGICPYTGWILQTPKNTGVPRHPSPDVASLDRIDSSKGYVKGNVEFISLMAQLAKHSFSKKDVVNFCMAVYLQNC